MKWFVTVKPKSESSINWSDMIGVTVEEQYGNAMIIGYSECRKSSTGELMGRLHMDGSPLLFLEQFIELRLWHKSNNVVPCSDPRRRFDLTRFGAKYYED